MWRAITFKRKTQTVPLSFFALKTVDKGSVLTKAGKAGFDKKLAESLQNCQEKRGLKEKQNVSLRPEQNIWKAGRKKCKESALKSILYSLQSKGKTVFNASGDKARRQIRRWDRKQGRIVQIHL